MKPVRIQRMRSKGWRMPENTVYVGRGSRWGNSWKIGSNLYDPGCAAEEGQPEHWRTCKTATDCVQGFRQFVDWDPDKPSYLATEDGYLEVWGGYSDDIHVNRRSIRKFLKGKNLACWCAAGEPCHADVLLELANN